MLRTRCWVWLCWVLVCWVLLCGGWACDASKVDASDVKNVFDKTASSGTAASSAAPSLAKVHATAKPDAGSKVAPRERKPVAGPCIATAGEPARVARHVAGRPACRRSRIEEYRDAAGTPRYACIFAPRDVAKRKPLPLLIFLHGEKDDPRAVHRKTRLRKRYDSLDLTGDPQHRGFVVLAPQARRILVGKVKRTQLLRWDSGYTSTDNVDVATIDHFVEQLVGEGLVDARQIYAIGASGGGQMALLYAMLRPDRVAAVGLYGSNPSALRWSCDASPPPVGVIYRACDAVTPCADIEQWLATREDAHQPTWSMRLGSAKATEPACVMSARRCRKKKGTANHERWPKPRERDLLEYLSRYSIAQ